jgi:hypothetical protein
MVMTDQQLTRLPELCVGSLNDPASFVAPHHNATFGTQSANGNAIEPLAKYPAHLGEVAFFAVLIERFIILGREGSRVLALRAHFRHAATRAR